MEDLVCAVVGYGGIAEFHTEALKQIDGVKLHTVIGRRKESADAFKQKHGFEAATTDYEAGVENDTIDAVIVASPSELHHTQATTALKAGKHVLVEIPLAMSHKGAGDIAGLARKQNRKVLVAHTRRFDSVGRFTKEFITSGRTGAIYQHHSFSFWYRHENVGWTGYQRSWTDDVLFHHGCHLVDFSLWTVDAPVRRVHGELAPKHAVTNTSMDVSMLVRYANETIGTIGLSYNAKQRAGGNRYLCENGVLEVDGKTVRFNGETVFETPDNPESGVLVQDREFIDAIREDRQPSCSAEDGLRSLALLQQVYDQMITAEGPGKYERQWGL